MKIIYIAAQLLSISSVFCMLLFVKSLYDRRKYGLIYSIMRKLFHKDCSKLNWYINNKEFIYYILFGVGLSLILINLLSQISDESMYNKNIIMSVGLIFSSIFNILILIETLNNKR